MGTKNFFQENAADIAFCNYDSVIWFKDYYEDMGKVSAIFKNINQLDLIAKVFYTLNDFSSISHHWLKYCFTGDEAASHHMKQYWASCMMQEDTNHKKFMFGKDTILHWYMLYEILASSSLFWFDVLISGPRMIEVNVHGMS